MPHGDVIALAEFARGEHVMTVCNACRYCEQYCPVFPAMEERTVFGKADLTYLANLCHNCGECLYACQFAPPHEFGINVPQTLARIRLRGRPGKSHTTELRPDHDRVAPDRPAINHLP